MGIGSVLFLPSNSYYQLGGNKFNVPSCMGQGFWCWDAATILINVLVRINQELVPLYNFPFIKNLSELSLIFILKMMALWTAALFTTYFAGLIVIYKK